ncbi:MAG: glycosyltransferase family 4 protein [Okeania sp. SIO2F4]|uniref:hypothetical protein n=1 Tax=Okeania sp. SIO2F4 TaxID=2607790 RepID=UPI00142AEC1D|nr:hypothetical protein [Okeania sp. SIO2F4]NES02321.1 glycosyltransferase family 4 protein [Okeania sp. SIO2F4]
MLLAIDFSRVRGTKVIWTLHDKRRHSILHPKLGIWFQSKFIKRVDGCISHCQVSREWADLIFPMLSRPHTVIPHGYYRQAYPNNLTSSRRCAYGTTRDS